MSKKSWHKLGRRGENLYYGLRLRAKKIALSASGKEIMCPKRKSQTNIHPLILIMF